MIQNLKEVTSLNPKATKKVILWEIAHSLLIACPSGILLIIIWELFVPQPDVQKIGMVLGFMFLMLLLQLFIASRSMILNSELVYDLSSKLRIKLCNRIQRFSLGFFKKKDPGEIASIVLQDVSNFEGIFGHSFGNLTIALFGTAALSCFLFIYDWRLTLCLLAVLPLIYPFLQVANFVVQKFGKKKIEARNQVGALFLEYLQGIRHLKSYGLTGAKHERLERAFQDLRKKSIQLEALPGPMILMSAILFEIGFLAMLALGLYYLQGQTISIPVLITFLILGYNLYGPLKIVMVDYLVLRFMNESLDRVLTILKEPTMETTENEIPRNYNIQFDQVSFGYLDTLNLKDINFSIPARSMCALVGHSGSGKTTLASLLARFWDVQTGSIKIGNVDIRQINQDKFYSFISEVFQEVYLFDDSIYNNIKIGRPGASKEEIIAAAEKAQVLDFLWDLPEGINCLVGEGGSKLSGGQKQRISIARALLKDAPIVILDEATASLDPENEIYIQQAIQELVKSKTVLVIAHKLSTIQQADQIIVLDKGRIAEKGKHTELLQQQGIYSNMWHIQQQTGGWKMAKT